MSGMTVFLEVVQTEKLTLETLLLKGAGDDLLNNA